MWRADDPQGNEAHKVRFELIPYLGDTNLDIGCGPAKVFPHFIGLDSGKDTQIFGIEMKPDICGDCRSIPLFGDGAFDLVFSSHTLEHIEDHQATLAEWWRLVKPGGHLALYLPHKDLYPNIGTPHGNPDHKHDFLPEDIVQAMEAVASGWDLVVNQVRSELREYSFFQVYRKLPPVDLSGVVPENWTGPREGPNRSRRQSWQQPKPEKSAAVVRLGAYGDALWASSLLPHLKDQGYHVTVYTEKAGAEVLAADPHIDRIIVLPHQLLDDNELILYFIWESRKYTRWINTTGAVETRLLPHPNQEPYYWPDAVRAKEMNRNYLEAMHDVAELPHDFRQRFYPTRRERAWALEERAKLDGPVVVVAPTGSGLPKTWPHLQRFMELMAARQVHTVVLGELRSYADRLNAPEHYGHLVGRGLPIRLAMSLAQVADVVVGTESAIVNAVAMEPMLKLVLLSHSSPENLTKHWVNTASVEATGVPCHPCHRLHRDFTFCAQHPDTQFAACQSAMSAEAIAEAVLQYLAAREKAAA